MTGENLYAVPPDFNFIDAKLKGPDGELLFDKGRAIFVANINGTLGGFYFYGRSGDLPGAPVATVFAIPDAEKSNVGDNHWRIKSPATGEVYDLYRGSGCGCGTAVKKMSLPALRYLNAGSPDENGRYTVDH